MPFGDGLCDLKIESVKLIKLVKLILSLHKSWVVLMRQSEKFLTRVVGLVFTVVNRELLFEVFQFVKGLTWGDVSLHGAILFEILTEDLDLNNKGLNVLNELFLEVSLVIMKLVTNSEGHANEFIPFLLEIFHLVKLISIHFELVFNECVHIADWLELEVDVRLLLANLFECKHDTAKRINILDFLLNLQTDLFDIVSEVGKKILSLLVDVFREDLFPLKNVSRKCILDTLCLKR